MKYSGERYVPESIKSALISFEHWHRYLFVQSFVENKQVLDVACGAGYGANLLSNVANSVVAVDISKESIDYAATQYKKDNLEFVLGNVCALEFEDRSFDVITSFETIEHIYEEEQALAMQQFKRLLKPGGVLLISTPNLDSAFYKDVENEFHMKEFHYEEFKMFLSGYFPHIHVYGQTFLSSSMICDTSNPNYEVLSVLDGNYHLPVPFTPEDSKFSVAICSNQELEQIDGLNAKNSLLLDGQNAFFAEYDTYISSLVEHLEKKDESTKSSQQYALSLKEALEKERREFEQKVDAFKQSALALEFETKSKVEECEHLSGCLARKEEECKALSESSEANLKQSQIEIEQLTEKLSSLSQYTESLSETISCKENDYLHVQKMFEESEGKSKVAIEKLTEELNSKCEYIDSLVETISRKENDYNQLHKAFEESGEKSLESFESLTDVIKQKDSAYVELTRHCDRKEQELAALQLELENVIENNTKAYMALEKAYSAKVEYEDSLFQSNRKLNERLQLEVEKRLKVEEELSGMQGLQQIAEERLCKVNTLNNELESKFITTSHDLEQVIQELDSKNTKLESLNQTLKDIRAIPLIGRIVKGKNQTDIS